jgi:hypothetical protein
MGGSPTNAAPVKNSHRSDGTLSTAQRLIAGAEALHTNADLEHDSRGMRAELYSISWATSIETAWHQANAQTC